MTTFLASPLYSRHHSFKTDQHVSILTLEGRVIIPYTGYNEHVARIQKGAEIGAAKLWYDKPKKQRKANAAYSKWFFAELQGMITYKAPLHESIAIKVDADNTSKACPMCGHTCDANRPDKGLLFTCQNCYYTLHADLVAARNITMRTLLVRQDWPGTGQLSQDLRVQMCRALKPKLHASNGMQHCGGA